MKTPDFMTDLEQRCDTFRNAYMPTSAKVIAERDQLLSLASSFIIAKSRPLSESQHLVAVLRQNIMQAA